LCLDGVGSLFRKVGRFFDLLFIFIFIFFCSGVFGVFCLRRGGFFSGSLSLFFLLELFVFFYCS